MDIPRPAQHGSLVLRQPPIPKAPRMHPELLPVKVPDLEHAMLGKERVGMVPAPPVPNQSRKALLVPQEGTPQGHVPALPKVPPHHKAVLQVWENQSIIE